MQGKKPPRWLLSLGVKGHSKISENVFMFKILLRASEEGNRKDCQKLVIKVNRRKAKRFLFDCC